MMALYTQLTRAEVEAVAARYGFTATGFTALPGGVENTSYRVSEISGGELLITVLEKRDPDDARRYAEFLAALTTLDIPVPGIYRNADGEFVDSIRDKPVVAMEFIDGTCYDDLPEIFLEEAGRVLA